MPDAKHCLNPALAPSLCGFEAKHVELAVMLQITENRYAGWVVRMLIVAASLDDLEDQLEFFSAHFRVTLRDVFELCCSEKNYCGMATHDLCNWSGQVTDLETWASLQS